MNPLLKGAIVAFFQYLIRALCDEGFSTSGNILTEFGSLIHLIPHCLFNSDGVNLSVSDSNTALCWILASQFREVKRLNTAVNILGRQ